MGRVISTVVVVVLLAIAAALQFGFNLPNRNPVTGDEQRSSKSATQLYKQDVKKAEKAFKNKEITWEEYNGAKNVAKMQLEFREKSIKDPSLGMCLSDKMVRGNERSFSIPSRCNAGYRVTVWPDLGRKKVSAALYSADGLKLEIFPKFIADRRSSVECDEIQQTCVFDGNVLYVHELNRATVIVQIKVLE